MYTLVKHKVKDYDKWREVFDSAADFRESGGEVSFQVFRSSNDKNEVWVLNKWDNDGKAKAFFQSEDLKSKMLEAGVAGKPKINFLDES